MGTGSKNYQAPEWMTAELLQKLLAEYFKEDALVVRDVIVKAATPKGSGFASDMHRATFNLKRADFEGKFSVIIKVCPKGEKGLVVAHHKLFEREIKFYTEILPRVTSLLASIGDTTQLAPACYGTGLTPEPFLIIEDMGVSGYRNCERGHLLTNCHALPTIEKLAKLHACSAYIAAETPEKVKFFEKTILITDDQNQRKELSFFPTAIQIAAEEVAHWRGFDNLAQKLFFIGENLSEPLVEMYDSHAYGFRVLNVGDLWTDNLLFQMNDSITDPQDVLLVYLL